jgi:cytochrome c-type biogenesis protein
MDAGVGIGVVIAFLGGIVSFASPCCLPLVPAYVGYMVGTDTGWGATPPGDGRPSIRRSPS